jgi:SAM-dependent methyltransferase
VIKILEITQNKVIYELPVMITAEDNDDTPDEVEIEDAEQEISSANTSINAKRLPAIFNLVNFAPNTTNLDFGGGRFDNATEYLATKGVTNLIYDKYNRSASHNTQVLKKIKELGGADTVTCSNVLNVIKEPEARAAVIKNCYRFLKSGGTAYFTVYTGNQSGVGTVTKSGYQLNRVTSDYVAEIEEVFSNVKRKGKLIIAKK